MPVFELNNFLNMPIISMDAHIIGDISDLRFNPADWEIQNIVFIGSNSVCNTAQFRTKAKLCIKPGKSIIKDVYLIPDKAEGVLSKVFPDNFSLMSAKSLISKDVETKNGINLGTVESVIFDTDKWQITGFKIKLNRQTQKEMGVKGLFSKSASGLVAAHVSNINEDIVLKKTLKEIQRVLILD